jgi:hypothetical protein
MNDNNSIAIGKNVDLQRTTFSGELQPTIIDATDEQILLCSSGACCKSAAGWF